MSTQTMALDVTIDNFGSIIMFTPISAAANDWFQEHVQCDLTWGGPFPASDVWRKTSYKVYWMKVSAFEKLPGRAVP